MKNTNNTATQTGVFKISGFSSTDKLEDFIEVFQQLCPGLAIQLDSQSWRHKDGSEYPCPPAPEGYFLHWVEIERRDSSYFEVYAVSNSFASEQLETYSYHSRGGNCSGESLPEGTLSWNSYLGEWQ